MLRCLISGGGCGGVRLLAGVCRFRCAVRSSLMIPMGLRALCLHTSSTFIDVPGTCRDRKQHRDLAREEGNARIPEAPGRAVMQVLCPSKPVPEVLRGRHSASRRWIWPAQHAEIHFVSPPHLQATKTPMSQWNADWSTLNGQVKVLTTQVSGFD